MPEIPALAPKYSYNHNTTKLNQSVSISYETDHDDVITWLFPHYWPFVLGIHQPPLDSQHRSSMQSFDGFFLVNQDKLLIKQSTGRWNETPKTPGCDVIAMLHYLIHIFVDQRLTFPGIAASLQRIIHSTNGVIQRVTWKLGYHTEYSTIEVTRDFSISCRPFWLTSSDQRGKLEITIAPENRKKMYLSLHHRACWWLGTI